MAPRCQKRRHQRLEADATGRRHRPPAASHPADLGADEFQQEDEQGKGQPQGQQGESAGQVGEFERSLGRGVDAAGHAPIRASAVARGHLAELAVFPEVEQPCEANGRRLL